MKDVVLLAWIAVAGAAGAVGRYGLGLGVHRLINTQFPVGTLVVNVVGCFLLGAMAHVGETTEMLSETARKALQIGLLGAFTTFSTFGHDTLRFFEKGEWHLALANIAANVLVGLAAVWAGLAMARLLYGAS